MQPIPDILAITLAKKPRELFMSFGLLHECLGLIGDLPNLALVAAKAELRTAILNAVLAERDANGVIIQPINIITLEISSSDVMKIVNWVATHCLSFFLDAIEEAVKVHAPFQDRLKIQLPTSTSSGIGSPV